MIVVYAGRRPGADFPDDNLGFVADQIKQVVIGMRPRLVIGSAAAGADLLVIEAATGADIPVRALVAGDEASFREASVSDKGPDWERRYDTQLGLPGVKVVRVELVPDDMEASYRAVTSRISEIAEKEVAKNEEIVVLAVARRRRNKADHTEDLIAHHEARGRLALRLDPARTHEQSDPAFVAMPFGVKPYPERGWKQYQADLSYTRIMTPALIDSGYRPVRADSDALVEVIDHTMLRHLNTAPLVLADLAMLNPNVMWEVGVRHAWRQAGTVLMAPRWVKSPFDVARIPLQPYDRSAQSITDAAAVAAIKRLRDVFAKLKSRYVDSPVFANVRPMPPDVELPEVRRTSEALANELLAEISVASDLKRPRELVKLAARAKKAPGLADTTRAALVEQCGLALNGMGEHDSARKLLRPLAAADRKYQRRNLHQQCAHAEIRSTKPTWLDSAAKRLNKLIEVHGGDSETYGLLGSAHKRRIEDALMAGRRPEAGDLDRAIERYVAGFEADPGDFYPGVNAIALLRLRGQRFGKRKADLDEARSLLPVVTFAVTRNEDLDGWALLTLADLALHAQLLGTKPDRTPAQLYERAKPLTGQQRASAKRQLTLFRNAGDPARVIDPLLVRVAGS